MNLNLTKQSQKPWKWEPPKTFPNFDVSFRSDREAINITTHLSKLPKEWEPVDGFLFEMGFHFDVTLGEEDDEVEVYRWLTSEFKTKLQREMEARVVPELAKLFSYIDEKSTWLHVDVEHFKEWLDFKVLVRFGVNFEESVPIHRLRRDLRRFDSYWFFDLISAVIQDTIYEEFPETDVNVYSLYPPSVPQPREIHLFTLDPHQGQRFHKFPFPRKIDIYITLEEPLHETVVRSLEGSSTQEEFLFKLPLLVTKVRNIVVHPPLEELEFRNIVDVVEFLKELD